MCVCDWTTLEMDIAMYMAGLHRPKIKYLYDVSIQTTLKGVRPRTPFFIILRK